MFAKSTPLRNLKEKCGIFGIYSNKKSLDLTSLLYYGLFSLQHRGQEGTGVVLSNFHKIEQYRDIGSVGEVFTQDILNDLKRMKPQIGIGHVRYSTAGSKGVENVQPLLTNLEGESLAVAHNGNLIHYESIKQKLEKKDHRFYCSSDTETILQLIAYNLSTNNLVEALKKSLKQLTGSFSLLIMTKDKLIGARDPYGVRPLCLAKLKNNGGYVLSSESCATDVVGATFIRDILPGEIVIIDQSGIKSIKYVQNPKQHTCIFEYVYFARPDSTIDGINCYLSRIAQGKQLYAEHPLKADLVICAPDSGTHAASGYANASGIEYGVGLIKNRYISRTFIKPSQELREQAVYIKLNPLKVNINNKNIILIDDSIVRGTTSHFLVKALKNAGAKKVYLLSASPMIINPCFLGIDTPDRKHLLAANNKIEQMRKMIGCDYLGFLSLPGLLKCCGNKDKFCTGCFNGKYPIEYN